MPAKMPPFNPHDVVEAYLSGKSINAIAKDIGVSRTPIYTILRKGGFQVRGQTEANRMMMAERSPEENRRNAEAAHDAVRGMVRSWDNLCTRAKGVEAAGGFHSSAEQKLSRLLQACGLDVAPQTAIGPYNADLTTGSIAVEVFGGNWHEYGAHRCRFAPRSRYILDRGWNLVVIWDSWQRGVIDHRAAEYVLAFAQETDGPPPIRGQYRMIGGRGQPVSVDGFNLNDIALVPSLTDRQHFARHHKGRPR